MLAEITLQSEMTDEVILQSLMIAEVTLQSTMIAEVTLGGQNVADEIQVDQPLVLNCATGQSSLSGATVPRIYYKEPDGTEGTWEVADGVAISGLNVQYDIPGDTLTAGRWYFHGATVLSGDTVETLGTRVTLYVHAQYEKPK